MINALTKVGVITALITLITGIMTALPEAQPLPQPVTDGVNWLFAQMYFFNAILDIPTFFICVYYAVFAFSGYLLLVVMRSIINWTVKLVL